MKTILLILSFFLLSNIVGCNDDGSSPGFCETDDQLREAVANTECLAEELLISCKNLFCESDEANPIIGVQPAGCTFVDCETLSCDDIDFGIGPDQPGLLTELRVDEISGFPIGIYQIDELEAEFICDALATP